MKGNLTEAHKARLEKSLNSLIRYDGVVMTKRELLHKLKKSGSTPREGEKHRIMFDRRKFNRMNGKEQIEYEKKCDEMVKSYELHHGDGYYLEVNKTEFEYFNSLNTEDSLTK